MSYLSFRISNYIRMNAKYRVLVAQIQSGHTLSCDKYQGSSNKEVIKEVCYLCCCLWSNLIWIFLREIIFVIIIAFYKPLPKRSLTSMQVIPAPHPTLSLLQFLFAKNLQTFRNNKVFRKKIDNHHFTFWDVRFSSKFST